MVKCIFTAEATAQQRQQNRMATFLFQFTCARERICAEKLRRTFSRSECLDWYDSMELPSSWFVKANEIWRECLNYRGEREWGLIE